MNNKIKLLTLPLLGLLLNYSTSNTSLNLSLMDSYARHDSINFNREIKNVIMFIGDGMGPNHVEAGEIYLDREFVFSDDANEKWTYHGYQNTDSLTSVGYHLDTSKSLLRPELNETLYDSAKSPYTDSGNSSGNYMSDTCYTDSAAGGTALASGFKTVNSAVGIDKHGNNLENLTEIAAKLGKKTGVISSDTIDGATPASFLSHVPSRHMSNEIVEGIKNSPANLVIGEKASTWSDSVATSFTQNGWHVASNLYDSNIESDKEIIVFDGLLPDSHLTPSLADLTIYALDKLDNDEGFFLMVEGASIDKASHSHQSKTMMNELVDFEAAIKVAEDWANSRDDTIMVVTADHETGGLYFDRENTSKETIVDDLKWLSYNHSRTRVGVDVYGDISDFLTTYETELDRLGTLDEGLETESDNYWDNTDVFKLCVSYL